MLSLTTYAAQASPRTIAVSDEALPDYRSHPNEFKKQIRLCFRCQYPPGDSLEAQRKFQLESSLDTILQVQRQAPPYNDFVTVRMLIYEYETTDDGKPDLSKFGLNFTPSLVQFTFPSPESARSNICEDSEKAAREWARRGRCVEEVLSEDFCCYRGDRCEISEYLDIRNSGDEMLFRGSFEVEESNHELWQSPSKWLLASEFIALNWKGFTEGKWTIGNWDIESLHRGFGYIRPFDPWNRTDKYIYQPGYDVNNDGSVVLCQVSRWLAQMQLKLFEIHNHLRSQEC